MNKILKLNSVMDKVAMSKTAIYAAINNRTFPAPIKLGERSVGWVESSVEEWLESKIQASQTKVGKA